MPIEGKSVYIDDTLDDDAIFHGLNIQIRMMVTVNKYKTNPSNVPMDSHSLDTHYPFDRNLEAPNEDEDL